VGVPVRSENPGYTGRMAKSERRVEVAGMTLLWGDRTLSKAILREESLETHLARPIEERLRIALQLVLPNRERRTP